MIVRSTADKWELPAPKHEEAGNIRGGLRPPTTSENQSK